VSCFRTCEYSGSIIDFTDLEISMDGILNANNLTLEQFEPKYFEDSKKRKIEITVRHPTLSELESDPTHKKLLGYVLFKWRKDGNGLLQICNFNAALYERNFKLGNTTKVNDKNQAGEHGEGFKLAALVLRRAPQNYSVRVMASRHFINFKFNEKGEILAHVSAPSSSMISKDQAKFKKLEREKKSRPLEPKIWEDVCFEIGVPRTCTDDLGEKQKTSRVLLADFRNWLTVTTHINPPKDVVLTPHGTLILDSSHKNKMYLRGLLLPNTTNSGQNYEFGYDFPSGTTNRDRGSLASSGQEAEMLASIWTYAVSRTDRAEELVGKYYRLLIAKEPRNADVRDAEKYLKGAGIQRIWSFMKEQSTQENAFYYCEGREPEVCALCLAILKRVSADTLN
jgi:hypothetical protein